MAFLADQYAGEKGCWVDFFGRPASAHKAIALLALEHDAPVAVCYARRRGGPMQFEMVSAAIADPHDVRPAIWAPSATSRSGTRASWNSGIRVAPEQYWWVHRRWKDTRKKREGKKAA